MARDITISDKTYPTIMTVTDNLTGAVTVSSNPSTHKSRHAYRDDAITTKRNSSGGYNSPTPYNTFRYGNDVSQFKATADEIWAVFSPCSPYVSVDKYYEQLEGPPQNLLGFWGVHHRTDLDIVPYPPGYLESRVLSSLQGKVQQNDWAISQSAGEFPETVALLLSASKRLLTSIKLVKQGRIYSALINLGVDKKRAKRSANRALRSVGNAANLQLEYQYGWKPLMSEIHSLSTAVEEGLYQPISKLITVRKEIPIPIDATIVSGSQVYTRTGTGRHVVKAGIKAFVTNDTLVQLGSHGLTNPLALAWELFPMSFVINWFLPIGNFLAGLSTPFGMEFRDGYMTKYVEWTAKTTGTVSDALYHCSQNDREFHYIAGAMGHKYGLDYAHTEWLECFERQLMPFPPPPVPYWDPQLNLSQIGAILTLMTAIAVK